MRALIQPKDYGDVIICQGMAKELSITHWPVADFIYDIFKHFPEITPIKLPSNDTGLLQESWDILDEYGITDQVNVYFGATTRTPREEQFINPRNDEHVENGIAFDKFKYELAGVDFEHKWSSFDWLRYHDDENNLYNRFKHLKPYKIVHEYSTCDKNPQGLKINIPDKHKDMNTVIFEPIRGYTVLDWFKVIQNAEVVHCIDSTLSNFIEQADIQVERHLHWYARESTVGHLAPLRGATIRNNWIEHGKVIL